jgi:hypothetical protein
MVLGGVLSAAAIIIGEGCKHLLYYISKNLGRKLSFISIGTYFKDLFDVYWSPFVASERFCNYEGVQTSLDSGS